MRGAADGQEAIADLRPLFGAREHIGCDIQEGPGVDRIEDIHALTFDDDSIGTIICLETLEHVADPLRAVQEMHRVLSARWNARDLVGDVLPHPRTPLGLLALHTRGLRTPARAVRVEVRARRTAGP